MYPSAHSCACQEIVGNKYCLQRWSPGEARHPSSGASESLSSDLEQSRAYRTPGLERLLRVITDPILCHPVGEASSERLTLGQQSMSEAEAGLETGSPVSRV